MSDVVKKRRVNPEPLHVGMRVSVPSHYFDHDATDFRFSNLLPDGVNHLIGSVILVHSKKARVKWDVDSTIRGVHFDEAIIEDINTPQQILDDGKDENAATSLAG